METVITVVGMWLGGLFIGLGVGYKFGFSAGYDKAKLDYRISSNKKIK